MVCELAAIKFKLGSKMYTVICIYRPTTGTVNEFLALFDKFLGTVSTKCKSIVILGDINIDTSRDSFNCKKLENILQQHNLSLEKLRNTRVTHTSNTTIDCCITNITRPDLTAKVLENIISDHHGVELSINFKLNSAPFLKLQTRNFSEKNLDMVKKALQTESWETVLNATTPDTKYNELVQTITYHMNIICPCINKTIKPKSKQPFIITEEITDLRKLTMKAKNQYQLTGHLKDKTKYSNIKKDYDTKIKQAKECFVNDQLMRAPNQMKETWKIINQERNKKPKADTVIHLNTNNILETDPLLVANLFNNFFIELGNTSSFIDKQDQEEELKDIGLTNFKTITEKDLKELTKVMKPSKAAGNDAIPGTLIHHCKEELQKPIVDVINSSIIHSKVPSKMKISLVYPKYKKQDKQNIENYRPIAILPCLSKYLEKTIHTQIINYLDSTNKIHKHQHGFRPKKSINTALSDLLEFISDIWEKKENITGIFLDLRKAFDCLNWDILLQKIWNVGIRGNAYKWMENYLTDRHQYVEIKTTAENSQIVAKSTLKQMTNGVPQGSVLGPLLFLIYINSLPHKLPEFTKCIMFADDTTLLVSGKNKEDLVPRVQESIKITDEELIKINLTINHTKSVKLNFTTKNTLGNIDNESTTETIETLNSTKFLGITIDNHLTWKNHIENLTKKLSTALYGLRRIRNIAGEKAALIAYNSLFSSHLRFGIIAWGAAAQAHLEPILILQKKAIRAINKLKNDEHCKPYFKKNKILTLPAIYVFETVTHSTKTDKTKRADIHSYNTRNKNAIDLPYNRLKKSQNHPDYIGAKLYNSLPKHITNSKTNNIFKKHLKTFLINNPVYSLTEFLETCQQTEPCPNTKPKPNHRTDIT